MRFLTLSLIFATSIFAKEQLLEIYTDKSFLTQKYEVGSGEFEAILPGFVTLEMLNLKTPCQIESSNLGKEEALRDSFYERLQEAKKEYEEAKDSLEAQMAKERLLERISLDGKSIKEIEKETDEFSAIMEKIVKEKRELQKELKEKEEVLKELNDGKEVSIKNLKLTLSCDFPSILEIKYPLEGLKTDRKSTFLADKEEGTMEIVQNIFITQNLGQDLKRVTLWLFDFSYTQRVSAPVFYPHYLDVPAPILARSVAMDSSANLMQKSAPTVEIGQSKKFWEVSNLSIPSGKTTQIKIDSSRVFADFELFIDGYADSFTYLKSTFKPDNFIGASLAQMILKGVLIGEQYIPRIDSNKESELFFGRFELIDVKKKLKMDFTTANSESKTQMSQMSWEYTITNNDTKAHNITLSERLPVSKSGDIKVQRLADIPTSSSAKGEERYSFKLNPNESKVINFGYSVTKPLSK